MYICDFSRSVGAGRATTLNTRGLTRSVMRLIVPPLPAVSRPSNTMQILAPRRLDPLLHGHELAVEARHLGLVLLALHLRRRAGRALLLGGIAIAALRFGPPLLRRLLGLLRHDDYLPVSSRVGRLRAPRVGSPPTRLRRRLLVDAGSAVSSMTGVLPRRDARSTTLNASPRISRSDARDQAEQPLVARRASRVEQVVQDARPGQQDRAARTAHANAHSSGGFAKVALPNALSSGNAG